MHKIMKIKAKVPFCLRILNDAFVIAERLTTGDGGVMATFMPTGPSFGLPDGLVSRECLIALVTCNIFKCIFHQQLYSKQCSWSKLNTKY